MRFRVCGSFVFVLGSGLFVGVLGFWGFLGFGVEECGFSCEFRW